VNAEENIMSKPRAWGVFYLMLLSWLPVAFLWFTIQRLEGELELRRESLESADWPSTPGTVTNSYVEVHHQETHLLSGGWTRTDTFKPNIAYSYVVGGHWYDGARVRIVSEYDEEAARQLVARYSFADRVRVWYRPGDPSRAALEPRSWHAGWMPLEFLGLCGFSILSELVLVSALVHSMNEFRRARRDSQAAL
jgi:hypothetical protein